MSQTININGQELDVEQFRNDWALALMSQGVIVKLSVHRWGGTAQLSFDELGVTFEDDETRQFMQKYIKLGTHKLLPPQVDREIRTVERLAKNNLSDHSFDTVWGKFVPFTAFDAWDTRNKEIRSDFIDVATSMGERYDDIVADIRVEYRRMAIDVWGRLHPQSKNHPTESFVSAFLLDIIGKIPSRVDMVSSFAYDSTYFIIPMPSFVENNIARARDIQRKADNADFESDLEKTTKERIAEEYVRRKQELIDGFLESTVKSMRKYVADLCIAVLDAMGKQPNRDVKKNHVNRIKKMVTKVRTLNFYDDDEIMRLLSELETEVDKFKGQRDKDIVVKKLQQIVAKGKEEFMPKNFNPAIDYLDVDV